MIVTKNLQKAFGDHMVLKGIDQHIEKGEKVVVIGPSGSGKSTFLALPESAGAADRRRDHLRRNDDYRSVVQYQ